MAEGKNEEARVSPTTAPTARGRRVVVGADGSPRALRAVEWAAREAHWRACPLVVVHATFWVGAFLHAPGNEAEAEREARTLAEAVEHARTTCPGLDVRGVAAEPPADQALIDASGGAELLVVGSRGLGLVAEVVMGSVSLSCVKHAPCPVLVVRDGPGGRLDPSPTPGH